MKIRGQRECKDCGARWSYYETGSVECPDCESLRSIGVESERTLHTDSPVAFDLTEAREATETDSLREAAERASECAREYVRKRGFVRGGDLQPLDDTYLAAQELRHAADVVSRGLRLDDDEELYFLDLLRGADHGDRPAIEAVPESMRPIRGLAYAGAVAEYRREMADWLDERDESSDDEAASALETLREHVKRVQALDGDVSLETADALVEATRDVSRYLRDGDDEALAGARDRFGRLA